MAAVIVLVPLSDDIKVKFCRHYLQRANFRIVAPLRRLLEKTVQYWSYDYASFGHCLR